MAGLTVRELAERIALKGDNIATITERIRHWTDEDMLTVIGDKNPGTGKKRLYSEKSVVEALILTIVSEAVGQPVTSSTFIKVFRSCRKSDDFNLGAASAAGERFLIIEHSRDLGAQIGTTWGKYLASTLAKSKFEAQVVLDLWKLHQRAGKF